MTRTHRPSSWRAHSVPKLRSDYVLALQREADRVEASPERRPTLESWGRWRGSLRPGR